VGGSGRVLFKMLSQHLHGQTEEIHEKPVRVASLRAEILTPNFLNTKHEC
jgi:hypothetical protein